MKRGLRPEEVRHEDVYWLAFLNFCAQSEPDAETLAQYLDRRYIPDTIWRLIFVSGPMVRTMSTIWNRACRALLIGFWPVIISMGMAPRCA